MTLRKPILWLLILFCAGWLTRGWVAGAAGMETQPPVVERAHQIRAQDVYELRVNSGGASYLDTSGQTWLADQSYTPGGWGYLDGENMPPTSEDIQGTDDDPLYQHQRYRLTGYQFDIPNGMYQVDLHFAETAFYGEGRRIFDVRIEGVTVLSNFDIYAVATHGWAHVESFPVSVNDGQLNIDFVTTRGDATIAALHITGLTPIATATATPAISPTPGLTPSPSATAATTVYSTQTGCLAVGPGFGTATAQSNMLLLWQGTISSARLRLDESNVRAAHSIYLNGQKIGTAEVYNAYETCSPGHTVWWDLDPNVLIKGMNVLSITTDADQTDDWGATNGQIIISGDLVTAQRFSFLFTSGYDNSTQQAFVQLPIGYDPLVATPMLVVLHGWNGSSYEGVDVYATAANERGWILLAPDMRGLHQPSLAVQHDVIDATAYVQSHYSVDPERIYITGFSMGGMMAAVTAAKYPDHFAALFEEKGPTNLAAWYNESLVTNPGRSEILKREIGHEPAAAPFEYQRRSAESMAQNLRHVPVSIAHGTEDESVPYSHALTLYNALNVWQADHVELHPYTGTHSTPLPFGREWVLDFLSPYRLVHTPTSLDIRTDESKSYYWLGITQNGLGYWTSVHAEFDAGTQTITATVDDPNPATITFDLNAMGLDPVSPYTVEDYVEATGDYVRYTATPAAGRLSIVTGDYTHQLLIYPPTGSTLQTAIYRRGLNNYEGATDTYLNSYTPNTSYGASAALSTKWNADFRPLIRFDLSDIPAGALIRAARLKLYTIYSHDDNPLTLNAFPLLRDWSEADTTWNQVAVATPWTTPGASADGTDYDSSIHSATTVRATFEPYTLNLRPVVKTWVADPASNHGVIIRGTAAPSAEYRVASAEYPDPQLRPELTVNYLMPTATPTPTPTATPTPTLTPTATATHIVWHVILPLILRSDY
ncbi:MAG: alpha/beta fold hydrolase [Chloroflexi bacterium]|nr:alpha/beta fold hydrolase [Chloroflexota bacterium]